MGYWSKERSKKLKMCHIWTLTFDCHNLHTSFSVHRCISRISRSRSSIKVIGSRVKKVRQVYRHSQVVYILVYLCFYDDLPRRLHLAWFT